MSRQQEPPADGIRRPRQPLAHVARCDPLHRHPHPRVSLDTPARLQIACRDHQVHGRDPLLLEREHRPQSERQPGQLVERACPFDRQRHHHAFHAAAVTHPARAVDVSPWP
jgi:hypothetical protein